MVPCPVSGDEAWRRLIPAVLKPWDRYKLAQGCDGIVRTYNPPEAFGATVENLNDALIGIYCDFTAHGERSSSACLSCCGVPLAIARRNSNRSGSKA
jgi:hypothetical protein